MLPVIALVGRPNVGTSTLFNYLTRSRDALVADYPGLTRDRQYGHIKRGERDCLVVDTGGIADDLDGIDAFSIKQVQIAIQESDVVIIMVDARHGLNSSDQTIADQLRKLSKPVLLVSNKIDGLNQEEAGLEFYALGLGDPIKIAATHGRGVGALLQQINSLIPDQSVEPEEDQEKRIGVAVVGRPNVGKSTLINRLLGEERVVVFDQPGTTRDSVFIEFERRGKAFTLIDTAGMRRRSKVSETIEKFSIIKTLQAIDSANVVIYLVDASEGITDQDASLLGLVLEAGRGLIIGLNKWDGLTIEHKEKVKKQIELKLPFLDFAQKHTISALYGSGVGKLFDMTEKVYQAAMMDMSTPSLTQVLKYAIEAHQPPLVRGKRIKLKYAHQGGQNPPIVVIHGNQTDSVPTAYKRYLMNFFRDRLKLAGTPIRIEFKSGDNPFKNRKQPLTDRQLKRGERQLKKTRKIKTHKRSRTKGK